MPSREREKALLREWDRQIADAREVIENLVPAADGLRRWLAKESRATMDVRAESGTRPTSSNAPTGLVATYGGRPALPGYLLRIVGERGRVHADVIVEIVTGADEFREKPPKRQTILTRLSELAKRGKLIKHDDGSYSLPAAAESVTDYGALTFGPFPAPERDGPQGGGP